MRRRDLLKGFAALLPVASAAKQAIGMTEAEARGDRELLAAWQEGDVSANEFRAERLKRAGVHRFDMSKNSIVASRGHVRTVSAFAPKPLRGRVGQEYEAWDVSQWREGPLGIGQPTRYIWPHERPPGWTKCHCVYVQGPGLTGKTQAGQFTKRYREPVVRSFPRPTKFERSYVQWKIDKGEIYCMYPQNLEEGISTGSLHALFAALNRVEEMQHEKEIPRAAGDRLKAASKDLINRVILNRARLDQ